MANATQKLIKRLRCDHAQSVAWINNRFGAGSAKTNVVLGMSQRTLTLVRKGKIGPSVSNFNS